MINKVSRLAVLSVAALIFSLAVGGAAQAECTPFPRIALWSELSHDFVRRHVDVRYQGDWDAYLAKLQRLRDKLRAIHAEGMRAGVTWRDKKISLKGPELAEFLKRVDERLRTTRCLAENDRLAQFSTAAGADGVDEVAEGRGVRACGTIPRVGWWKFKTHDAIVDYVARRHDGDFRPYIEKWDARQDKLQDIHDRGSSAVTNTGKVLKGPELALYLDDMRQRNAVVRCLAKVHGRPRA